MNTKIAWGRIVWAAISAAGALVVAVCGQPFVSKYPAVVEFIATVFSILAGFLIAVISIVSDTVELRMQSWDQDYRHAQSIKSRLLRHELTFYLYLVVLALVAGAIFADELPERWRYWLELMLLFFATLAFLLSFRLPRVLSSQQMRRLDDRIADWKSRS
jgi:drug/metabolite transporter (DMT)-like permease